MQLRYIKNVRLITGIVRRFKFVQLSSWTCKRVIMSARNCEWRYVSIYLDFSAIDDVEVVSFVTLLDDGFSWKAVDRKHGVEDVRTFVFVQMREQDILGDRFRQGGHRLVVLRHHLRTETEKRYNTNNVSERIHIIKTINNINLAKIRKDVNKTKEIFGGHVWGDSFKMRGRNKRKR